MEIKAIMMEDYYQKLKVLLQALEESADWALLSSLCDDANLHTPLFK